MKTKLNIGCGYEKKEDFINIDISQAVKPDQVVDVEKGLPFPDNTFEHIYSDNCLEHIKPDKWEFVLNEISRISKHNCILELILPFDNIINRINAFHYRTFTWNSFAQLDPESTRTYYSKLKLIRISEVPNYFMRIFYCMFPLCKNEIHLKFKIIKDEKKIQI